jgi:hypothetical protein
VLLLAGRAVAAEPPPPLTIPDLVGPRTLSLQAGIGLASGNESLFLNPAALAARKRYVADVSFLTDRRGGVSGNAGRQDYLASAIADSSTTAVAAGLAYVRAMKGVETGTMLRLGLASAVSQGLFVGLQGNYYDVRGADRISSAFNVDAGVFFQVTPKVSIGGAAYNLLHTRHHDVLPRGYGVGFAIGSDTSLQVVGDWRIDLDRQQPGTLKKKTNRYSAGVEYLYGGAVPLRAGFEVDDTSKTKWWSAGAGYVTTRVALDLAYRQSTTDPKARTYGVAVRVFVPAE